MAGKTSKRASHRSTLSLQKTEIKINVYDLLPPGKVASVLWAIGSSLLHSGVVINNREYAYGGHDRRGMTGVYYTPPRSIPPGGTFRCEILHGFTVSPQSEVEAIIKEASEIFQGTSYNLLTKNCNHFTAYLCEKLTRRPGPGWLNRAASIGVALPCVVPKEWIAPPDVETADGELMCNDDDHTVAHERSGMLGNMDTSLQRRSVDFAAEWDSEGERRQGRSGKGKAAVRDTSGRVVPPAERAPSQKTRTTDSS
ncbi:hypothetical protein PZA11_001213 [Diplocarpon coronariae]|uniref:PPPDE domain-containing protein n=1 Tax=Diplocarpon coronariae TaxID=2795749 RepID=A0A218Z206_9HELO|nr:hypothetical protein B2J93_5221 [Marssonina coronariae]